MLPDSFYVLQKTAFPSWYGAETSYYTPPDLDGYDESMRPEQPAGVYHGLPIRESDRPGIFSSRKSSIPRQRLAEVVRALRQLKGVDVFTDPKDSKADQLEFGWSVGKHRGYADAEMVDAVNKILYKGN